MSVCIKVYNLWVRSRQVLLHPPHITHCLVFEAVQRKNMIGMVGQVGQVGPITFMIPCVLCDYRNRRPKQQTPGKNQPVIPVSILCLTTYFWLSDVGWCPVHTSTIQYHRYIIFVLIYGILNVSMSKSHHRCLCMHAYHVWLFVYNMWSLCICENLEPYPV